MKRKSILIGIPVLLILSLALLSPVRYGWSSVTSSRNGDFDGDGGIKLGDVIYLLQYMFGGGPEPVPIVDSDCRSKLAQLEFDVKNSFLAELRSRGDIVAYLSPLRRLAFYVSGFSDDLHQEMTLLSEEGIEIEEIMEFDSTAELEVFLADDDPRLGDQRIFRNAECQAREAPCDDNCRNAWFLDMSEKDIETLVEDYRICFRVERLQSKCKDEYQNLCRRQTYVDKDCNHDKKFGSPYIVTGWSCGGVKQPK